MRGRRIERRSRGCYLESQLRISRDRTVVMMRCARWKSRMYCPVYHFSFGLLGKLSLSRTKGVFRSESLLEVTGGRGEWERSPIDDFLPHDLNGWSKSNDPRILSHREEREEWVELANQQGRCFILFFFVQNSKYTLQFVEIVNLLRKFK